MPEGMPEGMPDGMPEGIPPGMPDGAPGGTADGGPDGGPGQPMPGRDGGADPKGGRGGFMQHVLKTKFLESDAFDGVYKKAYRELYQKFYCSGTAAEALGAIAEQARSAGAGPKALDTAVAELQKSVTDRATALAANKAVTG